MVLKCVITEVSEPHLGTCQLCDLGHVQFSL